MATYEITAPDGNTYEITAPDNASEADVLAYAQENYQGGDKAPAAAPEPEAAPERSLGEDVIGGVNAALQGMTLGFSDEIGSVIGAGAAKLFGADEDFADIYSSMMEGEKVKRESFAEANPKTALALEVAGGFATGGAGGAKVLSAKALKNASAAKKLAAVTGVGAVEGGAAGFGVGDDLEDRVNKSLTGATIGAVLPLAMSGGSAVARKGGDLFSVDKQLGKGDDFMPITLADPDGWRGTGYRDVVSEAFGGGKIKEQAAPFVKGAEDKVHALTESVKQVKTAGKQQINDSVTNIKQQAKAQADEIDDAFRTQAFDASLPSGVSPEARAAMTAADTQGAKDILAKEWLDKGFQSAKARMFSIEPASLKRSLQTTFKGDPALRDQAGGFVDDFMEEFARVSKNQHGDISGKELMELRNKYARTANSSSDPLQRTAFRKISSKIDDNILKFMNPKDKAAYKLDMERWGAFSNLQKSVGKAGLKRQGKFTSDDWLGSTKAYKRGKGALQESAQEGQKTKASLKKAMGEQIKNNPVKVAVAESIEGAGTALKQAKEAAQDIKTAGGGSKPANLFRKLAATGLLSLPMMPLSGLAGSMPSGAATAKMLSQPWMQRSLAGQNVWQKSLGQGAEALHSNKALADILRQGITAGTVAGVTGE